MYGGRQSSSEYFMGKSVNETGDNKVICSCTLSGDSCCVCVCMCLRDSTEDDDDDDNGKCERS